MLLQSLEVQNLRAVHKASMTFGRGLNVLFGPNDLGKSSLLDGLRAAFLLPYTSTEGKDFLPWGDTQETPSVVVRFETLGTVWRITKKFGSGAKGTAKLERLGENDCVLETVSGKAVEMRIRETLAWGIPPPGQKKGLAETYLTTALLGHQDKVAEILEKNLAPDGTGCDLVTKAMGALGQDPLVKRLLRELEEQKDEAFTPGGQWKTNGPVANHARKIETQNNSLRQVEERVRQSKGIEEKVAALTKEFEFQTDRCSDLQRRVELLQAVAQAKESLNRLEAVREARLAHEAKGNDLAEKDKILSGASLAIGKVKEGLEAARGRLSKASGARDEVLTSAHQRREARKSELVAKRDSAAGRAQLATDVIQAKNQVKTLGEAMELADVQRDIHATQVDAAEKELSDAKAELNEAEVILGEALRQADRKRDLDASLLPAKIAERDSDQTVSTINALADLSQKLEYTEKALLNLGNEERDLEDRVRSSAREKQEHEAQRPVSALPPIRAVLAALFLGGSAAALFGFAMGLQPLALALLTLGGASLASALAAVFLGRRNSLQAERVWRGKLDDLEKNQRAWLEQKNQLTLNKGIAEIRADTCRSQRDQLCAQIGNLTLDLAEVRRHQAQEQVKRIENEVAKLLANFIPTKDAEDSVRVRKKQIREKEQILDETRKNRAKADTDLGILKAQLADAESKSTGLAAKLGALKPEEALTNAETEEKEAEQALKDLETTPNSEVEAAEKEVNEAQTEVTGLEEKEAEAREHVRLATQARDQSRQARDDARINYETLLRSAPEIDLATVESALANAKKDVEQDQSTADLPQDLEVAKTLLEERKHGLRKTEGDLQEARGRLKEVGGFVVREQRDQDREALLRLEETGRELELEYRATKYLLDVLKEEEGKQSAHIGRFIAEPVTKLFRDLTNSDRYSQIVFEPQLRVKNVVASRAEREWGALSIGTRDQLATLIRLVLAALLKTVVVFDDQLSQSDPGRLAWFRDRLRESVRTNEHQIIVITCRPLDYVRSEELPVPPSDRFEGDEGRLVVINLEQHFQVSDQEGPVQPRQFLS